MSCSQLGLVFTAFNSGHLAKTKSCGKRHYHPRDSETCKESIMSNRDKSFRLFSTDLLAIQ